MGGMRSELYHFWLACLFIACHLHHPSLSLLPVRAYRPSAILSSQGVRRRGTAQARTVNRAETLIENKTHVSGHVSVYCSVPSIWSSIVGYDSG